MDDNIRHARFVRAQEKAYDAAMEYEESGTSPQRERAFQKVQVWTMIVSALRRTT